MAKKRRSEVEVEAEAEEENGRFCRSQAEHRSITNGDGNGSEKTKTKKKKQKKTQEPADKENGKAESEQIVPTVTIAIPASIIDNAQSLELATRVMFSSSFLPPSLFLSARPRARVWVCTTFSVATLFYNILHIFSWRVKLHGQRPFIESMRSG